MASRREGSIGPQGSSRALEARGLVRDYGKVRVVDDVSLAVEPGEVVGLLGPNGAGKTTTFYMITGLLPPTAGTILLNGQDITRLPMFAGPAAVSATSPRNRASSAGSPSGRT